MGRNSVEKDSRASRRGDPAQQGRSLNLGTKPGAGLGSVIGWRSARKLATGLATATMRCHAIGRGAEVTTGKEPHLGDRVTSFGNLVPGELMRLSYLPILRSGQEGGPPRQKVGALLFQDSHDIPFRSRNNAKTIFFFFFFLLFFFSISHTFYPTVYDSFLRGEGGFSSIYSIENEKWKFMDMCRFDKS